MEGCTYSTPDQEAVIAAALLNAHTTTHQAQGPAQAARVEKVKRPEISSAGTTEDWVYFQSRWGDYVRATKLVGPDRVIQLLECCDEQLRRDLTRNAGGTLAGGTEEETLAAMKALAVREENIMVARVALHHMKQDRDLNRFVHSLPDYVDKPESANTQRYVPGMCHILRPYLRMYYAGESPTPRSRLTS